MNTVGAQQSSRSRVTRRTSASVRRIRLQARLTRVEGELAAARAELAMLDRNPVLALKASALRLQLERVRNIRSVTIRLLLLRAWRNWRSPEVVRADAQKKTI